ncbi:hypothetical protein B566_EDAN013972 [Ephemera danica]|nr:hypothetical protein B566_EDAN013972 [Ephemera danica]
MSNSETYASLHEGLALTDIRHLATMRAALLACLLLAVSRAQDFLRTDDDLQDLQQNPDCVLRVIRDPDAVNDIRAKFGLGPPPLANKDEEPRLAEVLLETTSIIRDRYALTYDEVWAGLPLLDTDSTDISAWCPKRLSLSNSCPSGQQRYRTYDGSCANDGPFSFFQGSALQPFPRLIPPAYSDDRGTLTEPECCSNPRKNRYCAPLTIPTDDPFYAKYGQRCISFLRTPPALKPGCRLGARSQTNELTSSIDASFVYGSNQAKADSLRLGVSGLMATLDILPNGLKPLLPLKVQQPDEGCTRPSPDIFCFLAGDNRVNEQLLLGVLHTLLETRMIVAAETQQITFSEFLPLLLGKEIMLNYDLILEKQKLSGVLRRPFDLYRAGRMDEMLMGMVNQVAQAMDDAVTSENPGSPFGRDLASINIARAREQGVPGSVDDVDLWSAGISEKPARGSMVGPTFACILGKSFRKLRQADRFWFENPDHPGAFTPAQLSAIRQVRFSRLLCDNGDNVATLQAYVLVLPDTEVNPRVPCSVLPKLDLTPWKDLNRPDGV